MSHVLRDTVVRLEPRREVPLTRPRNAVRPEAGSPSLATPARRHPLSGVRAAVSRLRRAGRPTYRPTRRNADSGVSPFAAGASRGVAFLVRR